MRVQFLGTAAAEGYPNPFCTCANCARAQAEGGPSLRLRSSLLIDDCLLLDLGPDILASAQRHNISLVQVRYCLQTHQHDDHLHPGLLLARSPYCGVDDSPTLQFYGTVGAIETIKRSVGFFARTDEATACAQLHLAFQPVAPFQTVQVGDYRVTTLLATHDPSIVPLLYLIEREGRRLFYATDTGLLSAATWAALHAWGGQLHAVIMDHTMGEGAGSTGHLNATQFQQEIARLREANLLAANAQIFATHLAHHSNLPHSLLVPQAAARGYAIAYDGLCFTV